MKKIAAISKTQLATTCEKTAAYGKIAAQIYKKSCKVGWASM